MSVGHMNSSGGTRLNRHTDNEVSERPLVTVITAVFNGAGTVAKCIESVLCQDYLFIEHIVIDGGSTDGTVDILRKFEDRLSLWISEPDHGIYDAWNKALLEARGEWICFLGGDDEFLPGAISAYMELAAKNPGAEYLSSRVKVLHSSGYERIIGYPWTWREYSKWMCAAHVGSMHRSSLFKKYGYFDTSYKITADYEFLLRPRSMLQAAFMPVETVAMRAGGVSESYRALREASRARQKTGGQSARREVLNLRIAMLKHTAKKTFLGLRSLIAGLLAC